MPTAHQHGQCGRTSSSTWSHCPWPAEEARASCFFDHIELRLHDIQLSQSQFRSIHRIDSGETARPYRAPTWLLALGGIFAFVNAGFMGAGAKVWNPWALWAGVLAAALILPVFWYRHYLQDKGRFPDKMLEDLQVGGMPITETKAGILPYVTLLAGVAVVFVY